MTGKHIDVEWLNEHVRNGRKAALAVALAFLGTIAAVIALALSGVLR